MRPDLIREQPREPIEEAKFANQVPVTVCGKHTFRIGLITGSMESTWDDAPNAVVTAVWLRSARTQGPVPEARQAELEC